MPPTSEHRPAPQQYLGVLVPDSVRAVWWHWAGVEWRRRQHRDQGDFYPPDQRFGVQEPAGLCSRHRQQWWAWQRRRFTGVRFPGPGGGGWCTAMTSAQLCEQWNAARTEWDERTIERMRAVEGLCRSGTGPDCGPSAPAALAPAPDLALTAWRARRRRCAQEVGQLMDALARLNTTDEAA